MTSRPGPSTAQRTGGGALQRPSTQARPVPPQPHAFAANLRQPDTVIDLTVDDTKPPVERAIPPKQSENEGTWLAATSQLAAQDGKPAPRGRPQSVFEETPDIAIPGFGKSTPTSHRPNIIPPTGTLPVPPRPGFRAPTRTSTPLGRTASPAPAAKKPASQRQDSLSTPSEAVRIRGKTVDFYPWNGNHPEDNLTSDAVKVGYFEERKGQVDINAAKTYVSPSLRSKSTLQTLSSLFVQALEKRQAAGRVKEASTFKPPPRITVTDTKREEWLRDLANPALAPKRRIPHGIRGKLLLEQCLGKNIPIARAIWLAKCVGANEMRAWMRKGASNSGGMGGELKWVREWTIFVEQFVEGTINNCGQQGWRDKMYYTIRLSTQLYTERLLDQDHFLDWLLLSLETTELDKLPIWLLLMKIYWQDLVAVRRRGRRLAETLLSHLDTMTSDDAAEFAQPLVNQVRQFVSTMAMSHRNCLVIPKTWKRHQHIIETLRTESNPQSLQAAARDVIRRNERLTGWKSKWAQSNTSAQKAVISSLDSLSLDLNIEDLSTKCLDLVPDRHSLAITVLQWACSLYREGEHRLYVAARLLRKWRIKGADIDSAILAFLGDGQRLRDIKHRDFFRLVAELVRSHHFSVGRYLQWLIASGSLTGTDSEKGQSCPIRLIAELPSQDLPENVLNLRETILTTTLSDPSIGLFDDRVDEILAQLKKIFTMNEGEALSFDTSFQDLSTSVRFEISHWLRQELIYLLDPAAFELGDQEMRQDFVFTPSRFYTIRDVLEQLEDFAILADVLQLAMDSNDTTIFAAIADTLNYHHAAFAAIGALLPLYNNLAEHYVKLRLEKPLDRAFLLALADLCCRLQRDANLVLQLTSDLTRLDQKSAIAACSPASDNMAENGSKMYFDEEIDRILASGTSMDENMVARVFAKVVTRIEEQIDKEKGTNSKFGQWFQRLKAFDEKTFDRHMSDTISSLLIGTKEELLGQMLPSAVGSGSLSLENFIQFSERTITVLKKSDASLAAEASLRLLDAILPMDGLKGFGLVQEVYRYRLEQEKLCHSQQGTALQLVRQAIDLCSDQTRRGQSARLDALLHSQRLLQVLRYHAPRTPQEFCVVMGISPPVGNAHASPPLDEKRFKVIKQMLDLMMDPNNALGLSDLEADEEASTLVNAADDLSVPFCQLELQLLFKIHTESDEEGEVGVADAIIAAIKESVESDKSVWSDLLTGLDVEMTKKIREYAESHTLSALTKLAKSRLGEPESGLQNGEDCQKMLQRYLSVINLTSWSTEDKNQGQIIGAILERLRTLLEVLSQASKPLSPAALCPWIQALLHLIIVHKMPSGSSPSNSSIASPQHQPHPPPKPNTSHQASLIWILRSYLLHPELRPFQGTTEYALDVAAVLSDDLPDEARTQLCKMESQRPSGDARIAWLLGRTDKGNDMAWLGLVTPVHGTNQTGSSTGTPAAAAQPMQHQHQARGGLLGQPAGYPHSPMPQQFQPQHALHQQQGFWQARHQPYQQPFAYQQRPLHSSFPSLPGQSGGSVGFAVGGAAPTPGASPASSSVTSAAAAPASSSQHNSGGLEYTKPIPFHLRRWEILPDASGGGATGGPGGASSAGNDTSLSLTLFGGRRVVR
ncbi:uncharacterized protein BKA78DRAFT_356261 [Phyllosticta capitalensis]|uniref:Mediator of RNA polymerase II transcription subunit 12 n=1 Tax=Phyllosticta capitalensis TaxID=121624 RepID=A0ABR1YHI8_9PEZI